MLDIDLEDLRGLLETHAGEPVLTLYLAVDPTDPENQRPRGTEKWRVGLRNALTGLQGQGQLDEARVRACGDRAETFLTSYLAGGRTLAMLADDRGVLHVELPVRLEQRTGYGEPIVTPLVRAMSDHRLYLAVLVDQESVRVLTGYLGFIRDDASLELSAPYGMPGPTRSGHGFRFDNRRDKYQRRFHRGIAEHIDGIMRKTPAIERLVIGGSETEAHGVAQALSQSAHQKLLGVIAAPMGASDADVAARVAPHAERFEEDVDLEEVAALAAGRRSGRAVFGAQPVVDAVSQSLAKDIYISSHLSDEELVERLTQHAVRSGTTVRFVHRGAAEQLDADEGVAARLYYAPRWTP